MSSKKKGPSPIVKLKVFMRDDFICAYCEKKITNADKVTVDHVFPISCGGGNGLNNLTTSCKSCNVKKGNLLLTQFLRAFEIKVTERLMRFL